MRVTLGTVIGIATYSLFLSSMYDYVNYRFDESRTKIESAQVFSSFVVARQRVKRQGDNPAYVQVRLPNSKLITFKYSYNADANAFAQPQTVSFTYGNGYFGQAYVCEIGKI